MGLKIPNPPFEWRHPKESPQSWAYFVANVPERIIGFSALFAARVDERLKAGDSFAVAANVARVTQDDTDEPLREDEEWTSTQILVKTWKQHEELRKWWNIKADRPHADAANAKEEGPLLSRAEEETA